MVTSAGVKVSIDKIEIGWTPAREMVQVYTESGEIVVKGGIRVPCQSSDWDMVEWYLPALKFVYYYVSEDAP